MISDSAIKDSNVSATDTELLNFKLFVILRETCGPADSHNSPAA